MIEYLDAPMPYIIGVSSKVWNSYCSIRVDEVQDTVIYEIDRDRFRYKEDLVPLTEPAGKILHSYIRRLVDEKDKYKDKFR